MSRKKIIIMLAIIFICMVIVVAYLKLNTSEIKDDIEVEVIPDEVEQVFKDKEDKILPITNMNNIVELKTCIEKYYNAYFNQLEDSKEIIYNCLSKKYIEEKNITENNIEIQDTELYDAYAEIYKAYIVTKNNGIDLYYVSGLIRNMKSYESLEFDMAVVLDSVNNTFEIYPKDYFKEDFFESLENGQINEFDFNDQIENRKDNVYVISSTKAEKYYQMLFNNIRNLISYDRQNAIDYIDYDYSNIKTKEQLDSFYEENKRDIFLMSYGSADVSYGDDETTKTVTLYDKNDKFYITLIMEGYGTYKFSIDKL